MQLVEAAAEQEDKQGQMRRRTRFLIGELGAQCF